MADRPEESPERSALTHQRQRRRDDDLPPFAACGRTYDQGAQGPQTWAESQDHDGVTTVRQVFCYLDRPGQERECC